jgi:hypothetical protein
VGTSIFAAGGIPAQEAELFGLMSTVGQGLRRKRNKDPRVKLNRDYATQRIRYTVPSLLLNQARESMDRPSPPGRVVSVRFGFWNVEAFGLIRTTTPVPPVS